MPEATCVDAIANSVVGIGSGAAFSTLSFGMLVWSVQLLRRTLRQFVATQNLTFVTIAYRCRLRAFYVRN